MNFRKIIKSTKNELIFYIIYPKRSCHNFINLLLLVSIYTKYFLINLFLISSNSNIFFTEFHKPNTSFSIHISLEKHLTCYKSKFWIHFADPQTLDQINLKNHFCTKKLLILNSFGNIIYTSTLINITKRKVKTKPNN